MTITELNNTTKLLGYETWSKAIKEYDPNNKLTEDQIRKAYDNVANNGCFVISVSGKIAAGKDTVAPVVARHFNQKYKNPLTQLAFVKPSKNEVTVFLQEIYDNPENVKEILLARKIDEKHLEILVPLTLDIIQEFLQTDSTREEVTAYKRTPKIRTLLQYWGTTVRRAQDENYWVKLCVIAIVKILARCESVYLTDMRFPSEAEGIRKIAGTLVRIDVSPSVQDERLAARDGIRQTEEQRNHISETALDNYELFDARVNSDNLTLDEVVSEIVRQCSK